MADLVGIFASAIGPIVAIAGVGFETAMPAAVTPLILAIEFAGSARSEGVLVSKCVSTCVFLTTLLAVPVLTVPIAMLQSGAMI